MNKKFLSHFILPLFIVSFAAACSSTKPSVVKDVIPVIPEGGFDEMEESIDLSRYRVRPESVFTSIENTIPEEFQVEERQAAATNPNSGFRIQIISTADINLAEQIQSEFIEWQNNENIGYNAESYLLFRQPFYRLHVGNFYSRAQAIEFSRIVKRKFPDAWVVFDTIDPNNITRKN